MKRPASLLLAALIACQPLLQASANVIPILFTAQHRTTLALDLFQRSNGSLGANWTSVSDVPAQIVSNAVESTATAKRSHNFYNAVTWPANQWSQTKITAQATGLCNSGPMVRLAADDSAFYQLSTAASLGSGSTVTVNRLASGSYVQIASYVVTLALGDTLTLEAVGSSINSYHNSQFLGSVNDTTVATGNAGFEVYVPSGGSLSDCALDNWVGGAVNVNSPSLASLAIAVGTGSNSNKFVNQAGAVVTPVGFNWDCYEYSAIQGDGNYCSIVSGTGGAYTNIFGSGGTINSGAVFPQWSDLINWGCNIVRIPVHQQSWLGGTYTDTVGGSQTHNADPQGIYQAALLRMVQGATAAGLYVIIDLHWSNPNFITALNQTAYLDPASITFWTQVSTIYKAYPNVIFEIFNEPHLYSSAAASIEVLNSSTYPNSTYGYGAWGPTSPINTLLKNGTPSNGASQVLVGGYPSSQSAFNWTPQGAQAAVNAIRATGATNVILLPGQAYDADPTWVINNVPTDSLNQLAIATHFYDNSFPYNPITGSSVQTAAQSQSAIAPILAKYPMIITEIGNTNSTSSATADVNYLTAQPTGAIGSVIWSWSNTGNYFSDQHGTSNTAAGTIWQNYFKTR